MDTHYVDLDPPGSFCQNAAIRELLNVRQPRSFLEVGVGAGHVARMLCVAGWRGYGVDSSPPAIERAARLLEPFIKQGRFELHQTKVLDMPDASQQVDVVLSLMVMEHVEDDGAFVRRLCSFVRPGGILLIGVPARMEKWSVEDDTAGHYRRYSRRGLQALVEASGVRKPRVWSVAVPTANLLFGASTRQIRKHYAQVGLTKAEQTAMSGIRDIPFKTVFPRWCRLILNDYVMWPLCVLQRLFYRTDLGLSLIACGDVN